MILIDSHCDTAWACTRDGNVDLYNNSGHIDIQRMKIFNACIQFFAAFIEPSYYGGNAAKRAMQIIDNLYNHIERNMQHISLCQNYNDIEQCLNNSKIGAILSIEGGEALQGDLAVLRMFYKLGVRSVCLTWNHRNEIADGVSEIGAKGGLTLFGKGVVSEMNKLGMIVDVSHISEPGFWDVLEQTTYPVIASHSNAKFICSHNRNLTNDQIIALAKNGGYMGMNLYPGFLTNEKVASVKDIIKHIEHVLSLVGFEHIGMGADFDGVEKLPEDILGIQDIYKIFDELAKLNYSQVIIDHITHLNALRVIKQVFKN